MGAIFDEVRKKKNLIKWNKYYVNYVWNRYSVDYSEKTKTIFYRNQCYSNSYDEKIEFSDYIDITVDDIDKAFIMLWSKYGYTPKTKLLKNKYVYYYPDGEYGYYGYYLKNLNIGETIYEYELRAGYEDSVSFLPNLENSDRYYTAFGNNTFNSSLLRVSDNTFRFVYDFFEHQIQTIKSKGTTAYSDVTSTNRNAYQDNGVGKLSTYGSEYWFIYSGSAKGSLIKTVYGKEGQYPDDGIQDGYYYELA